MLNYLVQLEGGQDESKRVRDTNNGVVSTDRDLLKSSHGKRNPQEDTYIEQRSLREHVTDLMWKTH